MSELTKSLVGIVVCVLATAVLSYILLNIRPTILAMGTFHQVAHKGAGEVTIQEDRNGRRCLYLTNFQTFDSPTLSVVLISATDASENETVMNSLVFRVGTLEMSGGDQRFALPDDLDLSLFHAVTIWNEKYRVNFTTAPLH